MLIHRLSRDTKIKNVVHWSFTALNGGAVKVGGFSVTGRSVNHAISYATHYSADAGYFRRAEGLFYSTANIGNAPISGRRAKISAPESEVVQP